MNALQRIRLARQLLTELSGPHELQQRLQHVVKKLKSIPEDCLSHEHLRKIRSIVSDFELAHPEQESPRISASVVHLCVDMIEYDAKVAELENIEY